MKGQACENCRNTTADEYGDCERCGGELPPEECDHCGTTLLPVTLRLENYPNPVWLCELCRYCRSAVAMAAGIGADSAVQDIAGMLGYVLAELRGDR